jgi:hypothetical protein
MPPATLPILYYTVFALFLIAIVLLLAHKGSWARVAMIAGTVIAGMGVVILIATERRLPLYGAFESTFYILLVVSLLEMVSTRWSGAVHYKGRISLYTGIAIVVILIMEINKPLEFNDDFYMYNNIWVNFFFNLRLMAAAFFIHGAILLNAAAWERPDKIPDHETTELKCTQKKVLYRARNILLTGIVIYLASEWSGSLWCLNWLGDSWRWSKGFFKAAIIFLLVMTSFHLPPSLSSSPRTRAIIGSCPALFIIWMIFIH